MPKAKEVKMPDHRLSTSHLSMFGRADRDVPYYYGFEMRLFYPPGVDYEAAKQAVAQYYAGSKSGHGFKLVAYHTNKGETFADILYIQKSSPKKLCEIIDHFGLSIIGGQPRPNKMRKCNGRWVPTNASFRDNYVKAAYHSIDDAISDLAAIDESETLTDKEKSKFKKTVARRMKEDVRSEYKELKAKHRRKTDGTKFVKRERAEPKAGRRVDAAGIPLLIHRQLGHTIKINDMVRGIYRAVLESDTPDTDLINASTLTGAPFYLPFSRGTINYMLDAFIDAGLCMEEKRGRTRSVWVSSHGESWDALNTNGKRIYPEGAGQLHNMLLGIEPKPKRKPRAPKPFVPPAKSENFRSKDVQERLAEIRAEQHAVPKKEVVKKPKIKPVKQVDPEPVKVSVQERLQAFATKLEAQAEMDNLNTQIARLMPMANQTNSPKEAATAKRKIAALQTRHDATKLVYLRANQIHAMDMA